MAAEGTGPGKNGHEFAGSDLTKSRSILLSPRQDCAWTENTISVKSISSGSFALLWITLYNATVQTRLIRWGKC